MSRLPQTKTLRLLRTLPSEGTLSTHTQCRQIPPPPAERPVDTRPELDHSPKLCPVHPGPQPPSRGEHRACLLLSRPPSQGLYQFPGFSQPEGAGTRRSSCPREEPGLLITQSPLDLCLQLGQEVGRPVPSKSLQPTARGPSTVTGRLAFCSGAGPVTNKRSKRAPRLPQGGGSNWKKFSEASG